MLPFNISINYEWHTIESDLTKCALCDSIMLGEMVQQVVFVNFEPIYTKVKLCTSCYDATGEEQLPT